MSPLWREVASEGCQREQRRGRAGRTTKAKGTSFGGSGCGCPCISKWCSGIETRSRRPEGARSRHLSTSGHEFLKKRLSSFTGL